MLLIRLYFIGLQLLTLGYTAQSLVMLTANSEDVKKLARKFVSESLADKIAEFIAISSGKLMRSASTDNDINDIGKDIPIESAPETIIINNDFEMHSRDSRQDVDPIRGIKNIKYPPLKKKTKLGNTAHIEPKYWQKDIYEIQRPDKRQAKRLKKVNKELYKHNSRLPYSPSDIDNVARDSSRIDTHEQFVEPKRPTYNTHEAKADNKKTNIAGSRSRYHPHIGNLETIEEETVSIEKQPNREKIEQERKPSQPHKDILKFANHLSRYKPIQRGPVENYKKKPIDNFEQDHMSKYKEDYVDNIEGNPIRNLKQTYIGNIKQNPIEKKKDPSSHIKKYHIDDVKQDFNDSLNQDHISGFQHDPIYNFKQESVDDFKHDQTDITNDFRQHHKEHFKKYLTGDFNQDPIDGTGFKLQSTENFEQQSTIKPLQIKKKLIKNKKIRRPLSKQTKEIFSDFEFGQSYSQPKLYFPNKPKMPEDEKHQNVYEDVEDTFILPKKTKQYHTSKQTEPDTKGVLSLDNQYFKHKRLHHLEPKPDKNQYVKPDVRIDANYGVHQNNKKAPFLTTEMAKPVSTDYKITSPKHILASRVTNNSNESEEIIIITTNKVKSSRGTKSTMYHGDHAIKEEHINKGESAIDARSNGTPKFIATSGKLKLQNPENDKLWEKGEIHDKPTSQKMRLF